MPRVLTAVIALCASLAVTWAPAHAAELEYVTLNEQGLKRVLLKESWGPAWFGPVDGYAASSSMTGARPAICSINNKTVKGEKSSSHAQMGMDFTQSKEGHLLILKQNVYQYADVQAAELAWQRLVSASGACAGTRTESIVQNGKKVGTATLKTKVLVKPSMYGQDQLVINVDVQVDEPLPGGVGTRESADEISIFTYAGAAIVEIDVYKDVPKKKNWVFSPPQIATVETLALLAIQRYHLTAYKAI